MGEPTQEQMERLRMYADLQAKAEVAGEWTSGPSGRDIHALLNAYEERGREVERLREGQSVMLDDLAALLRALGLGDHARPETPHTVMLSAIVEVERLLAKAERLRLWQVEKQHGPLKRRCACPGCRKMIPNCWVSSLCYDCGSENCAHAAAQPEEESR